MPRSTPKAGWVQGWVGLLALALWLCGFGAQARTRAELLPAPAQVHLALPRPAASGAEGKVKEQQGLVSSLRAAQAQMSEGESGGKSHAGPDIILGLPVPVPNPGKPESAGGYQHPGPPFPTGCAAGGSKPRPPPSL